MNARQSQPSTPEPQYILIAAPRTVVRELHHAKAIIDACTAILGQPVALIAQECLETLVPGILQPIFTAANSPAVPGQRIPLHS